jgi:hypothetical protein
MWGGGGGGGDAEESRRESTLVPDETSAPYASEDGGHEIDFASRQSPLRLAFLSRVRWSSRALIDIPARLASTCLLCMSRVFFYPYLV